MPGRDVCQYHGIRPDTSRFADYNITQQDSTGSDYDIIFDDRDSASITASHRDILSNRYIITDNNIWMYYYSKAIVRHPQSATNGCSNGHITIEHISDTPIHQFGQNRNMIPHQPLAEIYKPN